MNIIAVGTSHKYSPLEIRERLAFGEEELREALVELRRDVAAEAAIVSTCNRTEIYVVPNDELFEPARLAAWLGRRKHVDLAEAHLFTLHGGSAAQHLLEVASGVDSQVIGDIQIIGQVRDAYQVARESGSVGKMLNRLFSTALHAGKRVKTETELFAGAVSISYVAVELAKKIFYPFGDKKTLVVGAGDTGELTARNLRSQGVRSITITNRTPSRAHELIAQLGFGTAMPFEQLPARLHEFDIVIVSTGASSYVITYEHARAASARRSGEPQLIVDISVPRNVEPRVNTLPNIFCKDLNDLNNVIESNVVRRRSELPRAELIIAEELAKFQSWCNLLPVTPVVAELKRQSDSIARAELEKNRHRFSEAEFQHVEKLVGSVVRKIIGMPLAHLLDEEADRNRIMTKAEYVKLLFNLNDNLNGSSNGTADHADDLNGLETGHDAAEIHVSGNGAIRREEGDA
jgi:glutamyl-tRNA reductase